MVSVVQWAIFASSPIFMDPPDSGLDLVVASRCLLDHKSNQEATMPHADHAEADRPEQAKACAHGHGRQAHADGQGHAGHVREAREREHAHVHGENCGHGRGASDQEHAHSQPAANCCAPVPAAPAPIRLPRSETVGSDVRTAIRIMQMDCPTEEALIRKKFSRMPSVRSMDFNLMQRVLTVVHTPEAIGSILAALRSLDFTPELADDPAETAPAAASHVPSKPWWPLALAGVAAAGSEAVSWLGAPAWLAASLALAAI